MIDVDVLIVNALTIELDAVEAVLRDLDVTLETQESASGFPYLTGVLRNTGKALRVALVRPTRMGSVSTAVVAASLISELRPTCLAMSGVCAGNPNDVALGDVIVAEVAYAYDEGKKTPQGFQSDHRQIPLSERWQRLAQELSLDGLPTHGIPDDRARRDWLLEQLAVEADPARHPARERYINGERWEAFLRGLESENLISRTGARFALTKAGLDLVDEMRAYGLAPVKQLPFKLHVGPIASGNAVVKDGVTWDSLKVQGVRTVLGLEMEAAAIAQVAHRLDVPHWIVVKGVMDYADPNKDDRYKSFAAAASAQVLVRFLLAASLTNVLDRAQKLTTTSTNIVGNITGSNITVVQTAVPQDP
jgi:nucleoside phosphorylase